MDNLSPADKRLPATERVALSLKSAGVSITVTSITNMFAFLIGATSVSICIDMYMHVMYIPFNIILLYLHTLQSIKSSIYILIYYILEHADSKIVLHFLWDGDLFSLFFLCDIFRCVSIFIDFLNNFISYNMIIEQYESHKEMCV